MSVESGRVAVPLAWRIAVPAWVAPSALAALTVIVIRALVGPLTIDDAYITFRYSRNIAEGMAFVYNAGQHVIGTTTPLWTLLLALTYRLGFHGLPVNAVVLGTLADAVTAVLVVRVGLRLGMSGGMAALAGVLFALCPLSVANTSAGMEAPLFTLLVFGAVVATVEDRPVIAGFCAGLATVTRPEGLLLFGLLAVAYFMQRCWPSRQAAAVALAPLVAWTLYAWWWTGHPIAQSILAKSSVNHLPRLSVVLEMATALGLPGFSGQYAFAPAQALATGAIVAFLLGLAAFVAVPALCRAVCWTPALIPLVGFGPCLLVFYVAGSAIVNPWYLAPLAPFLAIGLVSALRPLHRRLPLAGMAGAALCLGWMGAGFTIQAGAIAPRYASPTREAALIRAADILRPHLTPHTLVALPEIGAFGYAARDVPILDTYGLISPQAVRYFTPALWHQFGKNVAIIPPRLIQSARPRFLVAVDRYLPAKVRAARWFQRMYVLDFQERVSIPAWHARALLVYRLRT